MFLANEKIDRLTVNLCEGDLPVLPWQFVVEDAAYMCLWDYLDGVGKCFTQNG